jgi:TPR repeat protein
MDFLFAAWKPLLLAGALLGTAVTLAACNTYYDPSDNYVRGLRFYDQGQHGIAREIWEPLAKAGDCDAEARLGMMQYMDSGDDSARVAAFEMIRHAAERGQPLALILTGSFYLHGGMASPNAPTIMCTHCAIKTDPVVATKWLLLGQRHAVYSGQRDIVKYYLLQAKPLLSAEQNEQAVRLADAWRPQGPECKPRSLW